MHSICFSTGTGTTKTMIKIRSLENLETFTKVNVSVDIRVSKFQSVNDAYYDIVYYQEEIVELFHSEDGQNVYGWGKRGFINGASLLGNDIKEAGDNKVLYPDISTHAVHLHPLKKDYPDLSKIHGLSLDNPTFYFSTI